MNSDDHAFFSRHLGGRILIAVMMVFCSVLMYISGLGLAFAACVVADPTGTPLAVRDSPRGKKTSTLINGTVVEIQETAPDNRGLPWARIRRGWVYANFLSCSSSGASAPRSPVRQAAQSIVLKCGNFSGSGAVHGQWGDFKANHGDKFFRIDVRNNIYQEPGESPEKMAKLTDSEFVLYQQYCGQGVGECSSLKISRIDGKYHLLYISGGILATIGGRCEQVPATQFPRQKF